MMDFNEAHKLWDSRFGSKLYEGDPIRGYWVLHVPSKKLLDVWTNLIYMVEGGELGYLISKCELPMTYGPFKGRVSICVFALLTEKDEVGQVLWETGYGHYISQEDPFRLIKKFRKDDEMFLGNDLYSEFGFP